ncbi:uncharacterized protein LOC121380241 [Gigantopelta aegis]|uniref:uncharacterized protein LOC121380241 n=1 Tax=Gigantopelta aegis TaxID=1735272 RepID=UPI001B889D81|nr:uncharacterized protein LOC121380241 [Gigantopelta aegis]
METKFDDMLDGDLENLPPLPRSIVKIFVSSTFSDMNVERNALLSEVVPQLKEFCAGLDLDFQLVDLRWGLTEDVQNDHSAKKLCLLEIENCQNVSLGPNFISILSHRYGGQALPSGIAVPEFENLRDEAKQLKLDHVQLLDKWYLVDKNCIPHQYVLQPIRRHFKHFGDQSSGCDQKRSQDTADWRKTQTALQSVLCQAAESLHTANKMSAAEKHKYFQSVTESEIEKAVFCVKNPKSHVLFYHRRLQGLSGAALTEEKANKYIAVLNTNGQMTIDQKLADFIENCLKRAKKILGDDNYQTLTTDWKSGGIDPKNYPEHTLYIQQLVQTVVSQVTSLINKARSDKKARIRESEYYSTFDEILHHLRFCNLKCKRFCGQTEILKHAKDFILNTGVRKPLIIHADSGAGKTSVMAMIMKNLSSWIKGEFVSVIRFLGTSPGSVNIHNVLFGVCGQLADCSDLIMEPVGYKNMESLVNYLPRFLRQVASTLKKPVIILLDSIDQLSSDNDAYSMWWMPTTLPANVKLIISTLPTENGILANIKKKLPATNNASFIEIPPLPQSTGKEIIEVFLKTKKRTVTKQQMDLLLTTFAKCANPLYLKLLLDEAVQWGSYSPVEDLMQTLAPSVRAAINILFDRLEKKFGQVLIKGALGYITIGLNGISEIELEDALSCDDTVLDDVYAFHDPPIPEIVRVPSVLWARIRYDIGEYLVERLSEGKITLFWYHRQFVETARDRYAHGKSKLSLHKTMFEIYLAESGVKKDISLSKRKKVIPDADRQVTSQPLSTENLRKLKCLTYHLIQASTSIDSNTAKKHVFCNLRFLCTKISALSANAVVKDMEEYLENMPDEEISVVKTFLQHNKNNLKNRLTLASNLLGYINPRSDQKYLVDLLQSAKSFLQSQNRSILIPTFACLASVPRVHKPATIKGFSSVVSTADNKFLLHSAAVDALDRDGHQKLANGAQKTEKFALYDLETRTIQWKSSEFSPFLTLLFDLQLSKDSVDDIYRTLLEGSLLSHAVNAAKTCACVLFNDGNLFLLKVNSERSKGFQCLSHIIKSSDYTVSDIHCIGDDNSITVIAVCQQSIEQESNGHVLIWKSQPDATFHKRSSADRSVLSQYTIKGIFSIFETEPQIPVAKLALEEKINKGMSFQCGQNMFVCVGAGGTIEVIDTDVCEVLRSWYVERIQNVCSFASGTLILVLGDGKITLFDITDESVLQTILVTHEITAIDVLWEQKIALAGDANGIISSFNLNTGQVMSSFPASSFNVTNIHVVDNYVAITSHMHIISILTEEFILDTSGMKSGKGMNDRSIVYDFCLAPNGHEIITSTYGSLKVCSFGGTCTRDIPSDGRLNKLYTGINGMVLGLDSMTGCLSLFNTNTGETILSDALPSDIIALTLTDDKTTAYAVSSTTTQVLYRIDLKALKVSKLFAFQKQINSESLSVTLSASNRYLVIQARCTEKDYEAVIALWKKGGRYPEQPHPHKYVAVDLTQSSGSLFNCFRPLTKIPHLGITCAPYRGNVVMMTVKRYVIFWDIPTGKCDQWMSKSKKLVMLYRPDWTGGDRCTGVNTCLSQSRDKTFIAVGSEDGYLFIYNSESGLPVGMKAPSTKHPSMVTQVSVSANNRSVASACHSGILKLWEAKTAAEVFSIQLDSNIRTMEFTPDSQHLVVCTAAPDSRLMVFSVHFGEVDS